MYENYLAGPQSWDNVISLFYCAFCANVRDDVDVQTENEEDQQMEETTENYYEPIFFYQIFFGPTIFFI